MNKIMKRKVNVFGKEFSVFAIAVVSMMVLASAALVPYISNSVSGEFSTSSPLSLYISSDGSAWVSASGNMPVSLSNIFGGSNLTFSLKTTNNADVEVPSTLLVNLSSDATDGATCGDFTNVEIVGTRTIEGTTDTQIYLNGHLDSSICDDSNGQVVLTLPSDYLVGETESYQITATAALNIAPSIYTVTAQEMTAP